MRISSSRAWVKWPADGDSTVSCCQQCGHSISLAFYMTAGLFLRLSGLVSSPRVSRGGWPAPSTAGAALPAQLLPGLQAEVWARHRGGRILGIQGPFEGGTSRPHAGVWQQVPIGIPGPSTSGDGSMERVRDGRVSQGHVCEWDICSLASLHLWPFPAGLMHSHIQSSVEGPSEP